MSANATDKFKKGASLFSTTLSSSVGSTDLTIPLNSVTGLATGTGVTLTIDGVDSAGVATPSLREVITGIVSGTNIVLPSTAYRGKEGTAQSHASGAVVTEYWTKTHWNDAIDGITADHNQDGTHKPTTIYDANGNETMEFGVTASAVNNVKTTNAATGNNPTLQASGESNKGINFLDSNGNEIIKTVATASAVNEITVTNKATGNGPVIAATGDDTNIDINLTPKGTGAINRNAIGSRVKELSEDGTTLVDNATIRDELTGQGDFTVSGGIFPTSGTLSSTMTAWTGYIDGKRELIGATAKTFTASKDTYVDVNPASGGSIVYTEVANGAASPALTSGYMRLNKVVTSGSAVTTVTSSGHDSLGNPIRRTSVVQGNWFAYVPTFTTSGGTVPTYSTSTGKYVVIGKTCRMQFFVSNSSGGTAGAGTNALEYSLPITAVTSITAAATVAGGTALLFNGSATTSQLAFVNTTTTGAIRNTDTSIVTGAGQSNANRQIYVDLTYEIA